MPGTFPLLQEILLYPSNSDSISKASTIFNFPQSLHDPLDVCLDPN